MDDQETVREILSQMLEALQRIERRFAPIQSPNVFFSRMMESTVWMRFA
jgi:hypothetical protein